MKNYASELRQQISKNNEHINKGKDIEKMTYVVEIIQMGENENKETTIDDAAQSEEPDALREDQLEIEKDKKPSFLKKCNKWISTPWSVKWKDIK